MTGKIHFFFDYISPYAYLAWTQIRRLAGKYDYDLETTPVLFASLLNAWSQMGPAEVPPKARWMAANCLRKAVLAGVPLNPPAFHPFNPLAALRISSLAMPEPDKMALIDQLFRAVWVDSADVSNPDTLASIVSAAGLDAVTLLGQSRGDEVKAKLRRQTDDAIAAGVFGVPTMLVGGEQFFGYDELPHLELYLQNKDPLSQARDRLEQWRAVRPSATRPR